MTQRVFTNKELREIIKARNFLKKYGFSVDLCCGCDEDNPQGDCLSCQMSEIKAKRRAAMEAELVAKENQRQLASYERYLMAHGYRIIRPGGEEIPLDIAMLEHRVRCGKIEGHIAWAILRQWGKTAKEAEELIKVWSWPRRVIGGSGGEN